MKAAILGNGPSRIHYTPNNQYEFVMGCNIPWTTTDATCIVDDVVIKKWHEQHDLINTKVYYSEKAWQTACELDTSFFSQFYANVVKHGTHYDSSGHTAVRTAISLGYTEIDVYGCDSYFSRTVESYTSNYIIRDTSPNSDLRKVDRAIGWRVQWNVLVESNPSIKIVFIR